jgi:NADPH-dependent 2,4-dienoyl-CoA reductase/sulfur reductase-like enzyme/nitrite reductase/ring-hydroxylating ferredoxin subunit
MGGGDSKVTGPDLAQGVPAADIPEGGVLLGQVDGQAVLLCRTQRDDIYAVGATCTHYGGPLAEGIMVGRQIRCPWHHARFDLRTGEPVGAPALTPLPCFRVEQKNGVVSVRGRADTPSRASAAYAPAAVVIVGAGAAGEAAAETLRREGYHGKLTLVGAEPTVTVDRPNLSKDYLAGTAPEEWIPLRSREYYAEQEIEILTGARAVDIDGTSRKVKLADGRVLPYEAMLLATGAEPIRLPIPGADLPHVHTLRTLADSQAIIARAQTAKNAVVIGASFIGLEAAASLRTRGLAVTVVAPENVPLERVFGAELGAFVRKLHEEKGVTFRLGRTASAIEAEAVTLDDGGKLPAELVVMGVGVKPSLSLAERAGCRIDRGVLVDSFLQTSVPGIFAAGDVARWPGRTPGSTMRIEHWVVAQRQGQTAARNMLGQKLRFEGIPFFWSQHYDVPIAYVGHVERWDTITVHGSIDNKSCVVAYRVDGMVHAAASIFRDKESLELELHLAHNDQAAISRVLASVT